ncbi:hypothetical protein DFH09DRAFT_1188402 [Mycena vulgaris]|nr:hypothetical protein DFH09DRAFT_1188402 [Mycena vulgaris]
MCGSSSRCVNRATQVECTPRTCAPRCGNQRLQRRLYADVDVVFTGDMGFGLRARHAVERDDLILEYVGEVIDLTILNERARLDAAQARPHFYRIQLDERHYIDPSRKGGLARFANHSCDPNACVTKWTVGTRPRLALFAKQRIRQDEEITIDYNFDGSSLPPRQCLCRSPGCKGTFGRSRSTDRTLGSLLEPAREIASVARNLFKRGRENVSHPVAVSELRGTLSELRSNPARETLIELLPRLGATTDLDVLRCLWREGGLGVFKSLLEEYGTDLEVVSLVLPLVKARRFGSPLSGEESGFVAVVRSISHETLSPLVQKILEHASNPVPLVGADAAARVPRIPRYAPGVERPQTVLTDPEDRPTPLSRPGEGASLFRESGLILVATSRQPKPPARERRRYIPPGPSKSDVSRVITGVLQMQRVEKIVKRELSRWTPYFGARTLEKHRKAITQVIPQREPSYSTDHRSDLPPEGVRRIRQYVAKCMEEIMYQRGWHRKGAPRARSSQWRRNRLQPGGLATKEATTIADEH